MRKLIAGLALIGLLVTTPTPGSAQVAGVAFAALHAGSVFDGYFGPWRITATGMDINYAVLCYSTSERRKVAVEAVASIPDGTSLANIRVLSTTAIVDACAEQGLTIPRAAVVLPAVQLGQ